MSEGSELPTLAELVCRYSFIVLAANGHDPVHWRFAHELHYVAQRVLERHYFRHSDLASTEEDKLFAALEELHKCPLDQFGVPGTWWQVQERLRRVIPLVEQLVKE